jgi:hypothetical protein
MRAGEERGGAPQEWGAARTAPRSPLPRRGGRARREWVEKTTIAQSNEGGRRWSPPSLALLSMRAPIPVRFPLQIGRERDAERHRQTKQVPLRSVAQCALLPLARQIRPSFTKRERRVAHLLPSFAPRSANVAPAALSRLSLSLSLFPRAPCTASPSEQWRRDNFRPSISRPLPLVPSPSLLGNSPASTASCAHPTLPALFPRTPSSLCAHTLSSLASPRPRTVVVAHPCRFLFFVFCANLQAAEQW